MSEIKRERRKKRMRENIYIEREKRYLYVEERERKRDI